MVSGSKYKIGLIVVLAILIVSVIGNFYFYNRQQGFIESETTLQNQLIILTTTYDEYVATHSNDNLDFTSLEIEYGNYISGHTILDEDYDNLQTDHNSLQEEYNSLQKEYSSHQNGYDVLEDDF